MTKPLTFLNISSVVGLEPLSTEAWKPVLAHCEEVTPPGIASPLGFGGQLPEAG